MERTTVASEAEVKRSPSHEVICFDTSCVHNVCDGCGRMDAGEALRIGIGGGCSLRG